MGMYTEIFVNVDLKEETPIEVLEVLQAMCTKNTEAACLEDKPSRWGYLFNSGSYYTPNTEVGKLTFDSISKQYSLLAKGDIKNSMNEIQRFFDYIRPWADNEFIGYYRYEENREPTLVYSDSKLIV